MRSWFCTSSVARLPFSSPSIRMRASSPSSGFSSSSAVALWMSSWRWVTKRPDT